MSGSFSLSLESQPPGPSGLNVYQLPTTTSSGVAPSAGAVAQSGVGGSGSPIGNQGGGDGGKQQQQTTLFVVPQSQDVLRSQASQEGDGLGLSNLLGMPH